MVALHQTALGNDQILAGRYMAVRLGDGGSNGVAYDSREAAIADNTNNASRCGYFQIPLERIGPKEAFAILSYYRRAYDSGLREDPAHALMIPNSLTEGFQ